jgi:opacity protein-like surface antigen
LTALTGLEQRNFGSQNIGLERFIGTQGLARYDFLRNLSGDINGRYRFSNRVGDADRPGDDDTGKNVHRYNVGAGLEYLPLKWMTIRLGYTFRKVISDNDSDEYDEHRGLLRVTLTTEQPFRTK